MAFNSRAPASPALTTRLGTVSRYIGGVVPLIAALLSSACSGSYTSWRAPFSRQLSSPEISLTTRSLRVKSGDSAILSWSSTSADTCMASGGWSGSKALSGREPTGALTASSRYYLTCTGTGGQSVAALAINVGDRDSSTAFPLRRDSGGRYLVDANGNPFSIQGDAGWSLIADASDDEAIAYLDDRQQRGYNTLLVNLLEYHFARNAPRNRSNQAPFNQSGGIYDYAAPNEAYFAHVDWVLRQAAQRGFLVLLAPSYLGYDGGDQGWYQQMVANGPEKLLQFGRYLGQRYQNFHNILWIYGGDYNPPNRALVEAIARGITEYQPQTLAGAHCGPDTAAADYWGSEPWLTVNTEYTYRPVYEAAQRQYARAPALPFFLIETFYEGEHDSTPKLIRTQAYQALLSGAFGQTFGNNPLWHFGGPTLYPADIDWHQALDSIGAHDMTRVFTLFSSRPWWLLEPDTSNRLLVATVGAKNNRVMAAIARDRSFAIAYLPSAPEITVNLGVLAGPKVSVSWFNPTTGTYRQAAGSPYADNGFWTFAAPGRHPDGTADWVLVLDSSP